jgi:phage recombination protein Bet
MNELQTVEFTRDQVNLIRSMVAPEATDNELKMFLHAAQKYGLDPLTRQLFCIFRNTKDNQGNYVKKMTIQTSIDGFRVIAERSGSYAGQDEPEYIYSPESKTIPSCAKVRVYKWKDGVRYLAAVGVAHWVEYVQTDRNGSPSGLWGKMPHVMLAKVAEAVALRKAFPQDLSGLYSDDEMSQATVPTVEVQEAPTAPAKAPVKPAKKTIAAQATPPNVPSQPVAAQVEEIDYDVWDALLNECELQKDVETLARANHATIKADPKLQAMFKAAHETRLPF